jgi:hypothetical protein
MTGFAAFTPVPSIEIASTVTPLSLSASCALCTEGISPRQIGHHEAQKRISSTRPWSDAESSFDPAVVGSTNAGIAVGFAGALSPAGNAGCAACSSGGKPKAAQQAAQTSRRLRLRGGLSRRSIIAIAMRPGDLSVARNARAGARASVTYNARSGIVP